MNAAQDSPTATHHMPLINIMIGPQHKYMGKYDVSLYIILPYTSFSEKKNTEPRAY